MRPRIRFNKYYSYALLFFLIYAAALLSSKQIAQLFILRAEEVVEFSKIFIYLMFFYIGAAWRENLK